MKYLLDTHILMWWLGQSDRLSQAQRSVLSQADGEHPLLLSEISLWEIATLRSLGRVDLGRPLRDWLDAATSPPLIKKIGISSAVATEVAALPDSFQRDPGDRIIIATARVTGSTLITSDRAIIDAGIVPTLT